MTASTEQYLEYKVGAAVRWLGRNARGWKKKVDVKILNMMDNELCVLGQAEVPQVPADISPAFFPKNQEEADFLKILWTLKVLL